jgi:hypothetical protein
MRRLLIAAAFTCVCSTAAFAATPVYLKDGSVIQAKKVWRADGKVQVLVNRDTLAEFNSAEVDLKKTFVKKRKPSAAKIKADAPKTAVVTEAVAVAPSEKKKAGITMPTMPSLPEKSPAAFAGKEEGAIRKHKREMAEKTGE